MKNVLIINQLSKGGIAHYTACLADGLINNGLKVSILTSFGDNEYGIVKNEELRVRSVLFPLTNSRILKLFFLFSNYLIIFFLSLLYKNIHFQWPISEKFDKYFINVLKFLGKNTIFTVHNVKPHEDFNIDSSRHYSLDFDKVIVHTDYSKNILIKDYMTADDSIFVIPHGNYLFINDINSSLSKEEACRVLGVHSDTFNILFFGYIRKYKGLDIILKILKDLPSDIRLIIAGSSSDFSEYDDLIKTNNLSNSVYKFIKYLDLKDFAPYFYSSDICVFPYRNIYQSGAMQISFAFSKVCVASNLDGFKENIKEGETGFMFDIDNVEELKEKILYCYNNRNVLESIGRNAYEYADRELGWDGIAERTVRLYK